jgi:hypothetical protein
VSRVARAADDGYASELVMGLRASADAERLAVDIGRAVSALEALRSSPPEPLADAARLGREGEVEEGLWIAFLSSVIGPGSGEDGFAGIERARTRWSDGELPDLDGVEFGAGGVGDAARFPQTVTAYRAWAERSGGQSAALAGEASWTPERRFERAFERLALPGLVRAPRYGFLRLAGVLGLAELEPSSLQVGADPRDPTALAAKRVFGIGDTVLLERRAADLARACGISVGELELALRLWGVPEPGAGAAHEVDAGAEDRARTALGVLVSAEAAPDDA